MNNWKVIFATAVIFGAGVLTGGLLVNYVQHPVKKSQHSKPANGAESRSQNGNQSARNADSNAKVRPPEILSKKFLQQLDTSLHLRPDQREAVQKIIGDGQNLIRKSVEDARLEIREILTTEQRHEFDQLVKRPFRKPLFSTNAPPDLPPATNAPAI